MPTSHLFEVALAVDGSELFSTKVSKLSRQYNRLKKKISTMADDPTTDVWTCLACSYAENSLDCLRCTMCTVARPRGSCSVLLVSRNSTHPVALAARGRKPPKARGAASTAPHESPPRGAKDKANERIAAQLAQPPCLWLRWCVHPSLPLMAHWPPLLLPPVLAWGSSQSLGEIRMIAMVPPFSLRAVLRAKRQVWSWGTVVRTSPPITHRSRQPTMR